MTALSWSDLRELASFRAQRGCAVSLYVDLAPELAGTPGELQRRTSALMDEASKLVRSAGDRLSHEERSALRSDLGRAREYVEHELDRDGSHGLALFSAPLDGFWRVLKLRGRVPDTVHVGTDLHVAPLVAHVENGEAVVAQVGRERGVIYALRDGRLETVADLTTDQPRRHDQGGWSQANFQRHVDELARAHLRELAEMLAVVLRRRDGATLVLAATDDARAELEPLLPDAVAGSVAGWIRVEAHASAADLQSAAEAALEGHRAHRERRLLDRWREHAGRGLRAAGGWEETCEAASGGRIETLLYDAGASRTLWRCPECELLQVGEGSCPLDGSALERHPEGLDLVVHKVLEHGGTAVVVAAHRDLDPVGGVGALLRY